MKVLENEAIDFVNNIYKKYKGKVDYFIAFHVRDVSDIDKKEFEIFCLQSAILRRGIIRKQLHIIDPEYKEELPDIRGR